MGKLQGMELSMCMELIHTYAGVLRHRTRGQRCPRGQSVSQSVSQSVTHSQYRMRSSVSPFESVRFPAGYSSYSLVLLVSLSDSVNIIADPGAENYVGETLSFSNNFPKALVFRKKKADAIFGG